MVISLNALVEPIGSMKAWLRPDVSVALPSGWLICDGSLVSDAASSFNGKTLPDLRDQFPRGHWNLTNANFPSDVSYFAGGTLPAGGSNTINVGHSHGTSSHSHTVNSHTHNHNLSNHTHPLPSYTTGYNVYAGSASIQGFIGVGPGGTGHNHVIGGSTSSGGASGGQTGSTAPGTNSQSPNTGGSLGTTDVQPKYVGFVMIIKVK